ncbi:hypothetical protein CPC08DRAFT_639781 [Agrocybe pediades]|nr:hypothetical protein CPC08DRAFT_639781 [Agrocybe pediades]
MPSIIHAATELVTSIVGIFVAIFNSIFAIFHGAFALVGDVFGSVFTVASHLIAMVTNMFQGVLGFVAANFFAIAVLGGAYYMYTLYQNKNRSTLRSGKTRA